MGLRHIIDVDNLIFEENRRTTLKYGQKLLRMYEPIPTWLLRLATSSYPFLGEVVIFRILANPR